MVEIEQHSISISCDNDGGGDDDDDELGEETWAKVRGTQEK